MMPGALIEFGLIPAIRELITRINKANQVIIELQLQNMEGRLDESVEITVYRIIQEILNNTIKHANALRAEICLERRNSIITLTIQSDGNPIDKKKIEHSSGIGWKNIFSRVTILNGKIVIDEGLKDGSIIRITIPDKAKA
jgi:signal transduction histidine kinase